MQEANCKKCTGCRRSHTRKGQRYCHDCHAAYMKRWRTKQREARANLESELAKLRAMLRQEAA